LDRNPFEFNFDEILEKMQMSAAANKLFKRGSDINRVERTCYKSGDRVPKRDKMRYKKWKRCKREFDRDVRRKLKLYKLIYRIKGQFTEAKLS
jgi:hypothetical protein